MFGTSPTQRGLKLPTKFVSAFAAFALVFSLSAPTFALSDDDAAPVLPVDSQVGETESGDTEVPAPGDEAEGEPEEVEPAPVADEPIVEEPAADEPSAPAQEPGTESDAPETDESDVVEPVFEEPADEPSQQQVDPLGSLFALTADEPDVEWNPEVTVFLADGTTPYAGQALEAGAELVVKGTGFDPEANVGGRGVPIPNTLPQGTYVVFGSFADNWRPSAGAPSSSRVLNNASQGWVLTESVVDQVPTNFQGAIRNQWVELSDSGEFTATITLHTPSAPLADGNWGIYTYAAGGVNNAAQETYTPISYFAPSVQVFLEDGTTPYTGQALEAGAELVVRGYDFYPEANIGGRGEPIPNDLPQGTYVVFGSFADNWRPSAGAPSSNRVLNRASQGWVLTESVLDQVPTNFQGAVRSQWVELSDSGEFRTTITLQTPDSPIPGGNWGIYTYGAGGVNNFGQETYTPVNYLFPEVQVYLEDGTTPYTDQEMSVGDKLVVKGAGFDPAANVGGMGVPIPADLPQGAFVVFGNFADEWRPSTGAPSANRLMNQGSRQWVLSEFVLEQVPTSPVDFQETIRADWAELNEDGTFTATVELLLPDTILEDGNWGIYTYAAGVGTPPNAAQELSRLVNFNAGETGGTPEAPEELELEAGILRWGISSTFLNYLEGQAGGSVTASAGATRTDGNLFEFPQAEGSTYNPASGTGEVPYRGVVKFFGHGMDMGNITAPSIKIINANSAKLYVTFGDGRVHLANIDLTKAAKKVNAGVVSYTNAPVEFTSEGIQKVFAGSTPSDGGVALSFAIGSVAKPKPGESNEGGSSGSNSGKPDNNGNSSSKPDVEIPVEIPQTEEEQQEREERYACYADSAALKWGFSERFRAYVSGTAYGDWSASGGATYSTPQFAWGNGSGSLDSKSAAGVVGFTGSINFTGHNGILNTTVANPAVEISGDNAYLLLDVAGVTQMGNAVTVKQIRFATLNLARANSSVSGHTTTFTGVPVVLTQAGSNAFGTYPAGFGMDSLNFTYTLNPDCGDVRAIAGKLGDTDAAAATDGEIELDEEMIAEALGDSDDSATDTEDDASNTQHDDDAPVAAVTAPADGADSGGGLLLAAWIVLAVLVLAGGAGGIVLALRPKKATV